MNGNKGKYLFKEAKLLGENSRILHNGDHLLICTDKSYTESYKRIFFNDLQIIQVYTTKKGAIYNLVYLVLIFIFSILLLVSINSNMTFLIIFFSSLIFFVFVLIGINIKKGPTSKCYIKTLSSETHTILTGRFFKTLTLLHKIEKYVKEFQGEFSNRELIEEAITKRSMSNATDE